MAGCLTAVDIDLRNDDLISRYSLTPFTQTRIRRGPILICYNYCHPSFPEVGGDTWSCFHLILPLVFCFVIDYLHWFWVSSFRLPVFTATKHASCNIQFLIFSSISLSFHLHSQWSLTYIWCTKRSTSDVKRPFAYPGTPTELSLQHQYTFL